ncbi:hypothetical protein OBBRIDRAFT_885512 [Obba rivulosa]|uniref:Peptide N-acetyl-beta-D-glucosaminyl asparaginase amidase A N-terminal domain-containing protein n=1 Tax=Obba rivulosa TaxID=1052685 RepID=A0A8E2J4V1_9APHY|nr:hypothetical protein OBBRIDRAFT_885512 [Obba rivulosa]
MFQVVWLVTSWLLWALLTHAQVLVDFQVTQPPPVPEDTKQCTIQILQRTFGFSYGDPEIVQFTPPTDCGPVGSWAGITLNFTVTSNGTQYDRLGIFTFQNVEIWRTSTPEPTRGDGIIWTYIKDVTRYTTLFSNPGTFILELDNLLETGLDGQYTTVLHATFYASSVNHPPASHADVIIPVTTLANNTGDDASVPPIFSLNVTVPRNTVGIYAELYASGNADEEMWYWDVANEYLGDLPSFGFGPFREVRMLVDGQLAGVTFPYAVIFTGGIVPTCWRPITSYGALDLPTYFIDLSPFVPLLTDGEPHNISIDVVSAETNHSINANWYVSGNLHVTTDTSSKPTTGKLTVYDVEPFAKTTITGVQSGLDVNVTVTATRSIHIEADIVSGSGAHTHVVWSQQLQFSNTQYWLDNATFQNIAQTASGTFLSTHNGMVALQDDFSYPLFINYTNLNPEATIFAVDINHSYDRTSLPSPFILGSTIHNQQLTSGWFELASSGNFGNGTSNNTFSYADRAGNTYSREVGAALNNIIYDHQSGSLAPNAPPHFPSFSPQLSMSSTNPRLPGGR